MQRESMEFDVVIVGAGPAGLSTAIQLAKNNNSLNICLLEKGAEVGSHIISGAVMDPCALTELIPDWKKYNAPVDVDVTEDHFHLLTAKKTVKLPTPSIMKNKGNYIISLAELCRWLGKYATNLGVNIFPGFPAHQLLFNENKNKVIGVQTVDMGLDKSGEKTDRYQPGMDLLAKHVVLAEGCRGSLSEQVMSAFNLRKNCDPQSYGIGIKELWKIDKDKHQLGKVLHTIGWPLDHKTYGGGFIYHFKDQLLSIGLIIGLDYQNPYLNPFQEMQRFKLHPSIKPLLENGECMGYGARALNEGGFQSLPKLEFPGGLLVGCSAGLVNVGKIKGIHNAIRSGILAANAITGKSDYQVAFNQSPIYRELYKVRNLRPGFHQGLWKGLFNAAIDHYIFAGHAPWTKHFQPDHKQLEPAKNFKPINYPNADKKITFDLLNQVYLTGTKHREDEPCHLKLKDPSVPTKINLPIYAGPESRYCPAQVYEFVQIDGETHLQINAANCIHCKTCDIKDPTQNIVWETPEGREGPNYQLM